MCFSFSSLSPWLTGPPRAEDTAWPQVSRLRPVEGGPGAQRPRPPGPRWTGLGTGPEPLAAGGPSSQHARLGAGPCPRPWLGCALGVRRAHVWGGPDSGTLAQGQVPRFSSAGRSHVQLPGPSTGGAGQGPSTASPTRGASRGRGPLSPHCCDRDPQRVPVEGTWRPRVPRKEVLLCGVRNGVHGPRCPPSQHVKPERPEVAASGAAREREKVPPACLGRWGRAGALLPSGNQRGRRRSAQARAGPCPARLSWASGRPGSSSRC